VYVDILAVFSHVKSFKTKKKVNYIKISSLYPAVNTLRLGCKYQSINLFKPTGYVMHQEV